MEMEYLKYIVKENDTLFGISKAHNVTVSAIMNANNLVTPLIYPGQVLLIPKENQLETIIHQVKNNESIEDIAAMYDVSPYEIGKMNDMGKIKIKNDEIIKIPTKIGSYEIDSDDTLDTIISKTKRSTRHLMVLNQNEWLKPGTTIKI